MFQAYYPVITLVLIGAAAMNAGIATKSWTVGFAAVFGLGAIISAIVLN